MKKLKILFLEDRLEDVELTERELRKGRIEYEKLVVETQQDFEQALNNFSPDVILSDHSLALFNSEQALRITQEKGVHVPFILLTSMNSEEIAVSFLRAGADDYVLKEGIVRLPIAILNALEKRELRKGELEAKKLHTAFSKSEANLKSIFDNTTTAYILLDASLNILSFNQSAFQNVYSEVGKELKIEAGIFEYISAEQQREIGRRHSSILKGEKQAYEIKSPGRDGLNRWCHVNLFPVHQKDGSILGMAIAMDDITFRKEAEEKLKESEERFRVLIENNRDGIVLTDKEFRSVYRSPSATKILGFNDEERLNKAADQSIHPDDLEKVKQNHLTLLGNPGRSVQHTCRIKHKSGHYIWIEATSTNLLDDKSVKAIVTNFRDITERKHSEEALRKSEANLSAIIENTNDLIYSLDRELKFITFNSFLKSTVRELCGIELVTGGSIFEILTAMQSTDADELKNIYARSLEGETLHFERFYILNSVGHYFNFSVNPIRVNGNIIGLSCFAHDITKEKLIEESLRRSEGDLHSIFDNTTTSFILLDSELKVRSFNPMAREWVNRFVGVTINVGFDWLLFFPLHRHDDLLRKANNTLKGTAINYEIMYDLHKHSYYFDVIMSPVFGNNGVQGMCLAIHDITKRKESELEMLKLVDHLQFRNNDLKKIAHIVSHNLRAPVAKILGLSSMLDMHHDNSSIPVVFESIKSEAVHLDEVVQDMNRIVSVQDSVDEEPEVIAFEMELQLIEEIFRNEIIESDAILLKEINHKNLVSTRGYIYNILYNLFSNAFKFRSPDRQLVIKLETTQDDEFVRFTFSDNGIGIDLKKHGDTVFGLYSTFHGSKFPGRGIGLNIIKTQTEAIGGKIEIHSKVNKGTTFKIYIPTVRERLMTRFKQILLIDDDKVCNFMNKRIVTKAFTSANVNAVTRAAAALEYLKEKMFSDAEFPDTIFVDVNMPEMNGWEFLDELQKFPKHALDHCNVIMLSSSIDAYDISKSKTYKVVRQFITKPLTMEKINEIMERSDYRPNL
jgi:PAS domain S-box-containing protein